MLGQRGSRARGSPLSDTPWPRAQLSAPCPSAAPPLAGEEAVSLGSPRAKGLLTENVASLRGKTVPDHTQMNELQRRHLGGPGPGRARLPEQAVWATGAQGGAGVRARPGSGAPAGPAAARALGVERRASGSLPAGARSRPGFKSTQGFCKKGNSPVTHGQTPCLRSEGFPSRHGPRCQLLFSPARKCQE